MTKIEEYSTQFDFSNSTGTKILEYHERRPIYISKYGNNSKKESVYFEIVATKHES